jgi:hypothetical protein
MPQHDIPLTPHDILLLKMGSIFILFTIIGMYLYNMNEKRKV